MTEAVLTGLPPVIGMNPRALILGSMPGVASLRASQYYGHPRNLFWPLLAHALGSSPPAAYADRCDWLQANGVALWDVVAQCERRGSLDSAIRPASVKPNRINELLLQHHSIETVFFNGKAAESLYRRHHREALTREMAFVYLPSSSPANASMSLAQKQQAWMAIGTVVRL